MNTVIGLDSKKKPKDDTRSVESGNSKLSKRTKKFHLHLYGRGDQSHEDSQRYQNKDRHHSYQHYQWINIPKLQKVKQGRMWHLQISIIRLLLSILVRQSYQSDSKIIYKLWTWQGHSNFTTKSIKDMAEIFQKIKQENTAKIFHENYIVKHNAIFGFLTLIQNTGNSNILPTNTHRTLRCKPTPNITHTIVLGTVTTINTNTMHQHWV